VNIDEEDDAVEDGEEDGEDNEGGDYEESKKTKFKKTQPIKPAARRTPAERILVPWSQYEELLKVPTRPSDQSLKYYKDVPKWNANHTMTFVQELAHFGPDRLPKIFSYVDTPEPRPEETPNWKPLLDETGKPIKGRLGIELLDIPGYPRKILNGIRGEWIMMLCFMAPRDSGHQIIARLDKPDPTKGKLMSSEAVMQLLCREPNARINKHLQITRPELGIIGPGNNRAFRSEAGEDPYNLHCQPHASLPISKVDVKAALKHKDDPDAFKYNCLWDRDTATGKFEQLRPGNVQTWNPKQFNLPAFRDVGNLPGRLDSIVIFMDNRCRAERKGRLKEFELANFGPDKKQPPRTRLRPTNSATQSKPSGKSAGPTTGSKARVVAAPAHNTRKRKAEDERANQTSPRKRVAQSNTRQKIGARTTRPNARVIESSDLSTPEDRLLAVPEAAEVSDVDLPAAAEAPRPIPQPMSPVSPAESVYLCASRPYPTLPVEPVRLLYPPYHSPVHPVRLEQSLDLQGPTLLELHTQAAGFPKEEDYDYTGPSPDRVRQPHEGIGGYMPYFDYFQMAAEDWERAETEEEKTLRMRLQAEWN
jgi:hypothetical protein